MFFVIETILLIGIIASDPYEELGQAICEEKYNMDYESYNDNLLECKPKEVIEPYDGIYITVGGEQ